MENDPLIRLQPLVRVEKTELSRLYLLLEVSKIMSIPEKQFEKWSKTSAPSAITRESLLVDTLIAKGWRLVINEEDNETHNTEAS